MRSIIVREYLESLTEKNELDVIIPILLKVMEFQIISTPKHTIGLPQYGKDVVAVGLDEVDGVKKRFYFEIKGGNDRHITTSNFMAKDGIVESIYEAKNRPFQSSSIPGFDHLPIKIILAHNGELKANVKETFDGFIKREFPKSFKEPNKLSFLEIIGFKKKVTINDLEFEEWDIFKLTGLFNKYLFSEYLLTTEENISQFKKVLVLFNNPQSNYNDLFLLIDRLIENLDDEIKKSSTLNRKQLQIFESLKLIAFIINSYSHDAMNLESARRPMPYLVLRLWACMLRNEKVKDDNYIYHFNKIFQLYLQLLQEYFHKLIPVAILNNGLCSEQGGRYEQIGYPMRTFEFVSSLIFYFNCLDSGLIERLPELPKELCDEYLITILRNNESAIRPLLDNHSISIFLILDRLIQINREEAIKFLKIVIENLKIGYAVSKRLPDGGNNLDVVIRYILTGKKSVYYIDSTSLLMGMLIEFIAILGMEKEYSEFKEFIQQANIDIALFVPFKDDEVTSFLPDTLGTLEERLFMSSIIKEGYQSEILLEDNFVDFTKKTKNKTEFKYNYISDEIGYSVLRLLAHISFKTPFFPNEWRHRIE